jgi:hypothetical protein
MTERSRNASVLGACRAWYSTRGLTWLRPGMLVVVLLVINHVCGRRVGSAFALAEYGVAKIGWTACHGRRMVYVGV